jgi:hypothetical protein
MRSVLSAAAALAYWLIVLVSYDTTCVASPNWRAASTCWVELWRARSLASPFQRVAWYPHHAEPMVATPSKATASTSSSRFPRRSVTRAEVLTVLPLAAARSTVPPREEAATRGRRRDPMPGGRTRSREPAPATSRPRGSGWRRRQPGCPATAPGQRRSSPAPSASPLRPPRAPARDGRGWSPG